MIKKLLTKYRSLKLQQRVILAINTTLFITLCVISVIATINRQRTQYNDAHNTLFGELSHLQTTLRVTSDKDIESIKDVFYEKTFYNNGYASLIQRNGRVLIDKYIEGQNIAGAPYFREMHEIRRGKITYIDPNETSRQRQKKHIYFTYYEPKQAFITATVYHKDLITDPVLNTLKILLFALIFSMLIFSIVNYYVIGLNITNPIVNLNKMVNKLAKGQLPEKFEYKSKNEVGDIVDSFNALVEGIRKTADFANEIGKNNFDHEFTPLSDNDVLGNSLLEMRESLKKASEEEKLRKLEDDKRNWTTQGLAKFADILRQNTNNIEELSYNVVSNMVDYMNINQGGIFILNDEEENNKFLELTACFAFDRRKFLEKKIKIGEGLVGTCMIEKQTIYLTEVPQDYIRITSGLGDENPNSLLIVPLKVNYEIFGVIELASFNKFEDYHIEFVEKIGESIASTISNVKINNNTAVLLEKSQQQAEEMRAQEEEMRQNMEELSATQEAMAEKDRENQLQISELNKEKSELNSLIAEKEAEISRLKEKLGNPQNDVEAGPEEIVEAKNIIDEEVADEDAPSENIINEDINIADEAVVDEPIADEPIADEPIADEPAEEDIPTVDSTDDKNISDSDEDLLKGDTETQQAWEKHLGKSGKKFKKGKKK